MSPPPPRYYFASEDNCEARVANSHTLILGAALPEPKHYVFGTGQVAQKLEVYLPAP